MLFGKLKLRNLKMAVVLARTNSIPIRIPGQYFGRQNTSAINSLVYPMTLFRKQSSYIAVISKNILYDKRDQNQQTRKYAIKSDLKIKWVRPPKIPCFKPEKSGDLKPIPAVDLKQFPLEFQKSQELQTADDSVRKIFSLEFAARNKTMQLIRKEMVNSVKRHALDKGSAEAKIACMTGGVRDLQVHVEKYPYDRKTKVQLKELIDKRKKFMKYLRRWDYKRFEWLLEKLDLVYHPPPSLFYHVSRKDSLHMLTDKYCEDLKQERLAAYRESMEAQKEGFLREKAAKLQWIINEEKDCGVKPTVSQEEVDQVLTQLKDLELSKGTS